MRLVEVVAHASHTEALQQLAAEREAIDCWLGPESGERRALRILIGPEQTQDMLDAMQELLEGSEGHRIVVLPVEAALPRGESEADEEERQRRSVTASREELFDDIAGGARLDVNYLVLVLLSTVVAAIGLAEDSVSALIGAMVIAPLLGPNMALALGTALGDTRLIGRALGTGAAGIGLALALSVALGLAWPPDLGSSELMARTEVNMDSVALALASGAAAALSVTTGLPAVLVGVMVAVALLPPAAAAGILLGAGERDLALGAGLLLAVNVVCVNLAAKLVFLLKGVRPRTWYEREKARQSMAVYILVWIASLLVLMAAIWARG